uniref:Ig-like domain-containing protein n=1 Tax=Apteryx owenii TaxID=8824 RepID=A0A8B9QB47_APTOW
DLKSLLPKPQPSVSLFPNEVTIESDKEKTLTCGVRKYYPHSLDIKWIKISKDNQVTTVRGEDICIEASVENDDGTFNISSKLRVQPSLQDNGNVYRCVVNHRSLTDSILLDTTLTDCPPTLFIWALYLQTHIYAFMSCGRACNMTSELHCETPPPFFFVFKKHTQFPNYLNWKFTK